MQSTVRATENDSHAVAASGSISRASVASSDCSVQQPHEKEQCQHAEQSKAVNREALGHTARTRWQNNHHQQGQVDPVASRSSVVLLNKRVTPNTALRWRC